MDRKRQAALLETARKSIELALEHQEMEVPDSDQQVGAFVTLRENGQLRGCIGYLQPICPLDEEIARLARDAAFRDPRFLPVTHDEMGKITIEISLLSAPQPISGPDLFVPGTHGIIMTLGTNRAVFLPQVAEETGWNREQMLSALSQKAGLGPDAWKDRDAHFEVFTAEVFSE